MNVLLFAKKGKTKLKYPLIINVLLALTAFIFATLFYHRVFAADATFLSEEPTTSNTCRSMLVDTFFTVAFTSKAKAALISSTVAPIDEKILKAYNLAVDMDLENVFDDQWFDFFENYWPSVWNTKRTEHCLNNCAYSLRFMRQEADNEKRILLSYINVKNQELLINIYDSFIVRYLERDSKEFATMNLIAGYWYEALIKNQERLADVLPDSISEEVDLYYLPLVDKAQSFDGAKSLLELDDIRDEFLNRKFLYFSILN